jgi:hypothetical protein
MALVRRVYQICGHCGGYGKLESTTQAPGQDPVTVEVDCEYCLGAKYILVGWVTDATYDSATELDNLG